MEPSDTTSVKHDSIDFLKPKPFEYAIFETKGFKGRDFVLVTHDHLVLAESSGAIDDYRITSFNRCRKFTPNIPDSCFLASYVRYSIHIIIIQDVGDSLPRLYWEFGSEDCSLKIALGDASEPLTAYSKTKTARDIPYNDLLLEAEKLAERWNFEVGLP